MSDLALSDYLPSCRCRTARRQISLAYRDRPPHSQAWTDQQLFGPLPVHPEGPCVEACSKFGSSAPFFYLLILSPRITHQLADSDRSLRRRRLLPQDEAVRLARSQHRFVGVPAGLTGGQHRPHRRLRLVEPYR